MSKSIPTKRAIICARVSTDKQSKQGRSNPTQLSEMREYAQREGFEVVAEVADTISGATPMRQRPGGAQLYEHIERKAVDCVIFYTTDRVSRGSLPKEVVDLMDACANTGIELHLKDFGRVDLEDPYQVILVLMRWAAAADERRKIAERNTRGRRAKAASGRWVGHGAPPFGYRRSGWGREASLEIDPDQAEIVRQIFDLAAGGNGSKATPSHRIADWLNDHGVKPNQGGAMWRGTHVRILLRNALYRGVLRYGKHNPDGPINFDVPQLAIVDAETFGRVGAQLDINREQAKRNRKRPYLLSGLLRCECGRKMTGLAKRRKVSEAAFYGCNRRAEVKAARTCTLSMQRAKPLETMAWAWLSVLLTDADRLSQAIEYLNARRTVEIAPKRLRLAQLARDIARMQKSIQRNVSLYHDATDEELLALRAEVANWSKALGNLKVEHAELAAEVEQREMTPTRIAQLTAAIEHHRDNILGADGEERRFFLDRFGFSGKLRREQGGALWFDMACHLGEESRTIEACDSRTDTHNAPMTALYQESLRPQFHFTARYWNDYRLNPQEHQEGWINDVNGLVFLEGEYHLFAQRWWSCWLHAVSTDLIHWQELPPAFGEDEVFGGTQSGGAVIDYHNTSGLATGDTPVMVAFWSSTDNLRQCISYSNDRGRTWTKYDKNPVLVHPERDPKVIWYEPGQHWVMVLYGPPDRSYNLFKSHNLLDWTPIGDPIPDMFECPDMFQMPLDGDTGQMKWVIINGDGSYVVGQFDGRHFLPETTKQMGDLGRNFYATMTWNNMPKADPRRIQIAWMRGGKYPDMPFNQQISFPCELTLRMTNAQLRLFRYPIQEINQIADGAFGLKNVALQPGANPLKDIQGELFDIDVEIDIANSTADTVALQVRGSLVSYDLKNQVLESCGSWAELKPNEGIVHLRVLVDRMSVETFGNLGEVSITNCAHALDSEMPLSLTSLGGTLQVRSISVKGLRSIWQF